jgi:chaperonin GroES
VTERIIKTAFAEYIEAPYMGENKSGYRPIGDFVIIRPDMLAHKTSGGVELTDDAIDRHQLAAITGVVIECGGAAYKWNADRTRPYEGDAPQPGDRVIFEKFAGRPFRGADGNEYRIMDDKCVAGIKRK